MSIPFQIPAHVKELGDPHLGKKFTTGVSPEKRGLRESLVNQNFRNHLMDVADYSVHSCMGDLFDKFRVPEEVILFAAEAYVEAALANPHCQYVVLRGNHDAARDVELKSSFDVFAALVSHVENIIVVSETAVAIPQGNKGETLVFFPWHPFKNAAEMVAEFNQKHTDQFNYIAFGHWDILSFNEDSSATDNLIPFEQLKGCVGIINGHYHTPSVYTEKNIPVIVTGSMQPYSHAEDPEGQWYVTHTLAQVEHNLASSEVYYQYKNLRVLLEPDETPIAEVDCLSLTFKVNKPQAEDDLEVNLDTFDLEAIFRDRMAANNVSTELTSNLWERLLDQSAEA